jgi:hypothetical protein
MPDVLTVRLPGSDARTRYIVETVLGEGAGLPLLCVPEDRADVAFAWNGDAANLRLHPAIAPIGALDNLLTVHPSQVDAVDLSSPQAEEHRRDLLSALFHVVAGTEEVESNQRDGHDRFAASSSRLFRAGYDVVPLVDLWGDALLRWITGDAFIRRPERAAQVEVSHDVDAPFRYRFQSAARMARSVAGSFARGNLREGLGSPFGWVNARLNSSGRDPFDHFAWMMDAAEEAGLRATYYVIAGHTGGAIDGDYDVFDPVMMALWDRILSRGHRIGVHPSYESFRSVDVLRSERARVIEIHERLRRPVNDVPVRMHYLRYDPLVTPGCLAAAGFTSDSTLGFADRSGFRRGTCRPFRLWDHGTSRPLDLVEHPLMIMDATLLAQRYEALDQSGVAERVDAIASQCRRYGGILTLLWHNNYFSEPWHFEAFRSALRAIDGTPGSERSVKSL